MKSSLCCCESDDGRELSSEHQNKPLWVWNLSPLSTFRAVFWSRRVSRFPPRRPFWLKWTFWKRNRRPFVRVMKHWHRLCTEQTLVRTSVSLQTLHGFTRFIRKPLIIRYIYIYIYIYIYLSGKFDYHVVPRQLTASLLQMNKSSLFYT